MAHYMILTSGDQAPASRYVDVVVFTPVPAGNNSVGVPWTTVIQGYRRYRNRNRGSLLTSAAPVNQATQNALNNGTLFDWDTQITFPASLTNPQAIAFIESEINGQEAAMIAHLGVTLRYWGFEDDS